MRQPFTARQHDCWTDVRSKDEWKRFPLCACALVALMRTVGCEGKVPTTVRVIVHDSNLQKVIGEFLSLSEKPH